MAAGHFGFSGSAEFTEFRLAGVPCRDDTERIGSGEALGKVRFVTRPLPSSAAEAEGTTEFRTCPVRTRTRAYPVLPTGERGGEGEREIGIARAVRSRGPPIHRPPSTVPERGKSDFPRGFARARARALARGEGRGRAEGEEEEREEEETRGAPPSPTRGEGAILPRDPPRSSASPAHTLFRRSGAVTVVAARRVATARRSHACDHPCGSPLLHSRGPGRRLLVTTAARWVSRTKRMTTPAGCLLLISRKRTPRPTVVTEPELRARRATRSRSLLRLLVALGSGGKSPLSRLPCLLTSAAAR